MKIRMLTSISGHADERYGIDSFSFAPGEVVDVHKSLAAAWLASGSAEKAKGKPADAAEPEAAAGAEPTEADGVEDVKADDSAQVQEGA